MTMNDYITRNDTHNTNIYRLNQYMAFGLSGSSSFTFMVGADATVTWVDSAMGMPNAVDYFLTERVQVLRQGGSY